MSTVVELILHNAVAATGLALLVWIVGTTSHLRRQADLRHVLWVIVLLKLVTPPLVEWPVLPRSFGGPFESADRSPMSRAVAGSRVASESVSDLDAGVPATVASTPLDWRLIAAGIAALGTMAVLAFSMREIRVLRRAFRQSRSNDPRLTVIARQCAASMGLSRQPQIVIVSASISPLLWVRRSGPLIVLPRGLVETLSDEQLCCVISHEMAHYVRRDHWTNTLSLLVAAAFWWHPVAWWARRELRAAQEACCDALVINRLAARRQIYARTVYQALEFVQSERSLLPALASGFGGKSSMLRRIEMIANHRVNHRLSWWHGPILLAALAVLPCRPAAGTAGDAQLEGLPQDVQDAIRIAADDGRILEIEQETVAGELVYEAEVDLNGAIFDITISGEGTLLSKFLARAAVDEGDDKEQTENEHTADDQKDGDKDDNGDEQKDDNGDDNGRGDKEDDDGGDDGEKDDKGESEAALKVSELPEAVRETLEDESEGGEIEDLEREVEDGRVIYSADVEFESDGRELLYDVEIAEDGTLLQKVLEQEEEEGDDDDEAEKKDEKRADKDGDKGRADKKDTDKEGRQDKDGDKQGRDQKDSDKQGGDKTETDKRGADKKGAEEKDTDKGASDKGPRDKQ